VAGTVCDPANCPTGKRVDEALNAIGGLRNDLNNTRQDYKETQKSFADTHDALIEQTATLSNVVTNMERDRADWKESVDKLFSKVNSVDKELETKADKEDMNEKLNSKVSRSSVGIVTGIIVVIFTVLGFIVSL